MTTVIVNKERNRTPVTVGNIAGKIKRIRTLRGISQREVGCRCNYSEATGEFRINQFEKGQKIPRAESLGILAKALEIDETAIFDADLSDSGRMHHALFDIEDFHGLHPVEIDGKIYLEFGDTSFTGDRVDADANLTFLRNWYNMYKKYWPEAGDAEDVIHEKMDEYTKWRYMYSLLTEME